MCEQNEQIQQVKMSKIGEQQSYCYNLNQYKTSSYGNKEKQKGIQTKHIIKNERQEFKH